MREQEDASVDVRADVGVTWYWVLISDELANAPETQWDLVGLRLLEAAPYEPHSGLSRWWRVEDRNAPAEFTGHKVDIMVTRTYDVLDGPQFHLTRRIVDA